MCESILSKFGANNLCSLLRKLVHSGSTKARTFLNTYRDMSAQNIAVLRSCYSQNLKRLVVKRKIMGKTSRGRRPKRWTKCHTRCRTSRDASQRGSSGNWQKPMEELCTDYTKIITIHSNAERKRKKVSVLGTIWWMIKKRSSVLSYIHHCCFSLTMTLS